MATVHAAPRQDQHHDVSPTDLALLSLLTQEHPPSANQLGDASHQHPPASRNRKRRQSDRRPPVDPLMVAAAASAGPDVTRNHYLHSFFPHSLAYSSCDGERLSSAARRPKMESRQAPRHIRIQAEEEERKRKDLADKMRADEVARGGPNATEAKGIPSAVAVPKTHGGFQLKEDGMLAQQEEEEDEADQTIAPPLEAQAETLRDETLAQLLRQPSTPPLLKHPLPSPPLATTAPSAVRSEPSPHPSFPISAPTTAAKFPTAICPTPTAVAPLPPLEVQCRVRTRIPTPHGHIFLHLYTNNHDTKEHLAFVADHAQMASTSLMTNAVEGSPVLAEGQETHRPLPFIRSRSLDSKWHDGETDEERIVRGAYVGRLSATSHIASTARGSLGHLPSCAASSSHSDLPIDPPLVRIHSECFTGETIGSQRCDCGEQLDEAFRLITFAGRGVVVYLRQEGRGIGLLEKMRAYNLQDLGHDTVTANLMLGHGADMRTYGIAGAILRDLGIAGEEGQGGVRLLTNNPDKIEQIEKEGVRVVERVAMVPRSWLAIDEVARQAKKKGGKGTKGVRGRKGQGATRNPGIMSGSALLEYATMGDSVSSLPSTEGVPSPSLPSLSRSGSVESSVPLSTNPSRSPSPSAVESTSYSDEDNEEEYEDEDDAQTDSSAAYHLRQAGVGMIGASTTRSPELEKYLRTKIERMGHMLTAPDQPPKKEGAQRAHPLSESVTSLATGAEGGDEASEAEARGGTQ
ncbi:hypothetical protein JCM21900_005395 [Sporobolomyces salmonicolor]